MEYNNTDPINTVVVTTGWDAWEEREDDHKKNIGMLIVLIKGNLF
jgi:hypothetical protein